MNQRGVRKSFDDKSFLAALLATGPQRSIWSQINVENVSRLVPRRTDDRSQD